MWDTLKRAMNSRVAWFLAVSGWVWLATRYWCDGLAGEFTTLQMFKVVIATLLAVACVVAFVLNRGWRKRNDNAR